MKKVNFLLKLSKEGKLRLIEPSENVKESYLKKSESSLKSAQILLDSNQTEDAVPMAYYSMYNALTALLFKAGIKCENHTGAIILLKELFGIDNSKIKFAKNERVDKQYYVDFKLTKEDAIEIINSAKEFNSLIYDFISCLTTKNVQELQDEFQISFG